MKDSPKIAAFIEELSSGALGGNAGTESAKADAVPLLVRLLQASQGTLDDNEDAKVARLVEQFRNSLEERQHANPLP